MSEAYDYFTSSESHGSLELSAIRTTFEIQSSHQYTFSPMLSFYNSMDQKTLALVVPPQQEFKDTLIRFSEALHLYPALSASVVFITLRGHVELEDGSKNTFLTVFALSSDYCYVATMPYTVNSDFTVSWHADDFLYENVLEKEYSDISQEMIDLFYMYTHMDSSPFVVQEILSYLSFLNFGIHLFESCKISYYDMTTLSS